jgi:hypothetical protein
VDEDQKQAAQKALKEFGIPVVAGVVAVGAGILWRSKPDLRRAVPDMKGGVGDLMDDLRGKVEAVVNKDDDAGTSTKPRREPGKRDEVAERRHAREQRRNERRNQSGR